MVEPATDFDLNAAPQLGSQNWPPHPELFCMQNQNALIWPKLFD